MMKLIQNLYLDNKKCNRSKKKGKVFFKKAFYKERMSCKCKWNLMNKINLMIKVGKIRTSWKCRKNGMRMKKKIRVNWGNRLFCRIFKKKSMRTSKTLSNIYTNLWLKKRFKRPSTEYRRLNYFKTWAWTGCFLD